MNILIFGANGRTGRELMKQASAQGHIATPFNGDVRDYAAVQQAIRGQDAVLSGMGTKARIGLVITLVIACQLLARNIPGYDIILRLVLPIGLLWFFSRRDPVLSQGATNIVRAMKEAGVRRLIWQSALGVGDSKGRLGALFTFFMLPLFLRGIFADKEVQEQIIRESGLDWVIVRPGGLKNTEAKGKYHEVAAGPHYSIRTPTIARADVANFMLKQVTDTAHLHSAVGIAD